MRHRSASSPLLAIGVAVIGMSAGMAACSSEDGGSTASTTTTAAAVAAEPLATTDLGSPVAGTARVVLGSSLDVTLEIAECRLDLDAQPAGQVPAELVGIEATGATADGTPVLLDVKRFRSAGAATTITDTVTVLEGTEESPVRVVVAQRFEVGGQVTDGRDPDADDPLLRVTQAAITATGVFAPPGAFAGDAGAVEGAVAIACA